MRTQTNYRLWDAIVLTCAAASMVLYTWAVTRTRALWSDEIFAWVMIHDPSWKHMVHAWVLSTDGGGIAFYVLARLWMDLLGNTEMTYRMFSTAGMFAAFAVLWVLLRKMYPPVLALAALVCVWFGNQLLLWHMLQTRFYGLLLWFTASAVLLAVRTDAQAAAGRVRRGTLAWVFCVNLLLLCSHPFGAIYSGLVLCGAVLNDLLVGRRRWAYYVATALPWTVLLLFHTELHNAAEINKPWSWIPYPHVIDLRNAYVSQYVPLLEALFFVMLLVVLVRLRSRPQRNDTVASLTNHRQLLLIAALLLIFPALLWAASRGHTSYFVDRYFCPYAIGIVIVGAEVLSLFFGRSLHSDRPWPKVAAGVLLVFVLCSVVGFAMRPYEKTLIRPQTDFTPVLAAKLPRSLPILIPRADIFDEMVFYRNHEGLDLLTPIDWPYALGQHAPKGAVSGMHEMDKWREVGYFGQHIVDLQPFVAAHPHFILVEGEGADWLQFHMQDPRWHAREIGSLRRYPYDCKIYDVTVS